MDPRSTSVHFVAIVTVQSLYSLHELRVLTEGHPNKDLGNVTRAVDPCLGQLILCFSQRVHTEFHCVLLDRLYRDLARLVQSLRKGNWMQAVNTITVAPVIFGGFNCHCDVYIAMLATFSREKGLIAFTLQSHSISRLCKSRDLHGQSFLDR